MSDPDIRELLESCCEWTDYSCESICDMALDEIERLTAELREARTIIEQLDDTYVRDALANKQETE